MSISLLSTKFYIPPLRPTLVHRQRLLDKIDDGLRQGHGLLLVAAPAGFGKTTLIAEWLERARPACAWLSLDAGDNDPARFWRYVIAALQTVEHALGETALATLESPQPPPFDSIVTALLNDLDMIRTPLVLVLDDYHVIQAEQIHAGIDFLLDHLSPSAHVLISTRQDPPLALPRRRARMQLTELRAADLRFTPEETAEFLNARMKLGLSDQDLAVLGSRTEGWAVGLQLAAIAMQELAPSPAVAWEPSLEPRQTPSTSHEFVVNFAGDDRYVADYLVEEVLLREPPHVQTFLLQTAVLARLNASLCDAALGRQDSREILTRLENATLFVIPLDNRREWYRYHHLFADLLRQRLVQCEGETQVQILQRRASEWYEQHGFTYEAIEHALAARDDENVIRLIEQRAGDLFGQSEMHTLLAWIGGLPVERVSAHPKVCLIAAWAHRIMMHPAEVELYVQKLEQAVGATMEALLAEAAGAPTLTLQVRQALVEVTVLRVSLALDRMDIPRVFELAGRVLPYLDVQALGGLYMRRAEMLSLVRCIMGYAYESQGEVRTAAQCFEAAELFARNVDSLHLAAMALAGLAYVQVLHGALHRAAESYRRALQVAGELPGRPSPYMGSPRVWLGLLAFEWNDLATAQEYIQAGLAHAKFWNNWDSWLDGSRGWARLKRAQGDLPGALQVLEDLLATGQNFGPSILQSLNAARAQLWLEQGNLEAVERWERELGLDAEGEIPYWREGEALVLTRWLVAQGRLDEAGRLVQRLLESSESGERWGQVIERLLLQARVLEVQGAHPQALTAVTRALALAEPEGYIRTFVEEGEILHTLIADCRALIAKGPRGIREETATRLLSYTTRLLAAFPKTETPSRAGLPTEPLSARELQVLRLIAEGLSNQEIAARLVISITTCKSHTTSIYGKLQVNSRTQAIAAARALGILPQN